MLHQSQAWIKRKGVVSLARRIIGKALKGLGSIMAMIGLLMFGLIFIVAPGLAAALGYTFLKAADY